MGQPAEAGTQPGLLSHAGNDATFDTAFDRDDWIPTKAAEALFRNNMPLLAYIAGKPAHFTTKEHNYLAGQTVQKQVIIINDSRATVDCDSSWSLGLPQPVRGSKKLTIPAGQQERIPLSFALPADLKPGIVPAHADGQVQHGRNPGGHLRRSTSWPPQESPKLTAKTALFDPKGETAKLLTQMGVALSSRSPRTPTWAATAC